MQFSWIDIKLVFSYNPKIPILGAQNGPKIAFSSNNSSETHRNYWKPYINRFPMIHYDTLVQFSWIDIKLVFIQHKNPYFEATTQKSLKIPKYFNNSSETHRNYWKPYKWFPKIMTHFHELILNWYSATTEKSLFCGPKWAQNSIFQ